MQSSLGAKNITVFDFDGVALIFSTGGWGDIVVFDVNPLSDVVDSLVNV